MGKIRQTSMFGKLSVKNLHYVVDAAAADVVVFVVVVGAA